MGSPITRKGYRDLEEELKRLKRVERPKIIEQIEVARAHGDLTENAEYEDAKERQLHLDQRMREIEDRLARSEVIETPTGPLDKVLFGSTVRLRDLDGDKEIEYGIVGEGESSPGNGKVSVSAPLGRALLGKSVGDVVEVPTPKGKRELEILSVRGA